MTMAEVRKRLLPYIRLSLVKDNTTSPERQFEKISQYAAFGDYDLIEITEADYDLDVSGAISPFDRPGLGRWLKPDMLDKWDVLCVAKLDRISRSLFDFTSLLHWLEAHGKSLIILDPMLDLTTKEGRAMANVLMTFAEYEREVIGARVKDAYDKLIRSGNYRGGWVPFGYRQVQLAKGWGFEKDPVYAPVVQQMADMYLTYQSFGKVARWLRDEGVLSPRDIVRQRHGKPVHGDRWTPISVRKILMRLSVLGAVIDANGKPLRDEQGVIIYRADPLISRDTYEKIVVRAAQNPVNVRVNATPLLQVAICALCGSTMHHSTTNRETKDGIRAHRYYICHRANGSVRTCTAKRIHADPLEDAVFGTLLELAGHRKLRTKRIIAGRDYSEEMARVQEQIVHLEREIVKARMARKDFSELQTQKDTANSEMDRLIDLEPEPARLEYEETDQTFQDWWDAHDQTARNAFLREQGVKVVVSPDPLPEDLALARPEMVFSVAAIERPGLHAILHMGNLSDLLSRASDLTTTASQG
jgi:site-specific DNA recombinase